MQITHLSLTNFRNYGRLELDFPPAVTLLHGANAQGKTNLLEAIYYLATTKSHHTNVDSQLLNWDADQSEAPIVVGRLVAQAETSAGERLLEMRLIKEQQGGRSSFRREALVNRRKMRLMDLLGNLRVVLFLPQDVQIVTGSPAGRRRYLDITLCQTDNLYCRTLSGYNKVLEQRNALLRQIAEEGKGREVLPVFTEKLINAGSYVFARRARFLAGLAREAQRIHYEELTDGREVLRLHYLPRLHDNRPGRGNGDNLDDILATAEWLEQADPDHVATRFQDSLQAVKGKEMARGRTIVGPHRDDWRFEVNSRALDSYGSRGQQRSAVLALKLAEINWMAAETGETPILLLDEVVAELDERRRALLLSYVQRGAQAILTATDPHMFTDTFLNEATTMKVDDGRIIVDAPVPTT